MSIILAAVLVVGAVIVFATSASETKAENTPGKTIVIPLEGIADMMDRHQERIDECREKYKSFSNYYSSLQDVTNYFSVPIEELPQDLRDQIAALKKDGDAYLIEETHNLDYLRQSSRSMNQRELTIFTENIPDYVAEKKVSQSLADETLNILSDLVYNYKFNQPTALDQLPDYIQVSMAHSGTDYWIYKLSMVSDIDNSVYHEFHFTYVNPPKEN